jgi:hypothetical protein
MEITLLIKDFLNIFRKDQNQKANQQPLGEEIGFIAQVFGCWHQRITRPFMEGKTAYRSCLSCGARKPFDPKTRQCYGKFYYPSAIKKTDD